MKYIFVEFTGDNKISFINNVDTIVEHGWSDAGLGSQLGFYDILRDFEGCPIGLRFLPWEPPASLLNMKFEDGIIQNDNFENKTLKIYFNSIQMWDEKKSGDQMFEESRLYLKNNDLGLIFGISDLDPEEAKFLENYFLLSKSVKSIWS